MSIGQWLRIGDVEGETDSSTARLGEQCVGVGDPTARNVHEEAAVGHQREELGVHEVMRALIEQHRDDDDVGQRQQLVQ